MNSKAECYQGRDPSLRAPLRSAYPSSSVSSAPQCRHVTPSERPLSFASHRDGRACTEQPPRRGAHWELPAVVDPLLARGRAALPPLRRALSEPCVPTCLRLVQGDGKYFSATNRQTLAGFWARSARGYRRIVTNARPCIAE